MVELIVEYRAATIALTCAVALIGAYATVSICEQFRIATLSEAPGKQFISIVLAALCAGGVCLWAVFYVSMSSYRLITPTGAILLKSYDTDLAVASIAITIFMQYIAMQLASTDAYFSKSKGEIMADFLKTPTSRDPVDAVKSYSKGQILFLVCTHNPWRILCGGLLSGGALVIMRYMGMASVNIQGSIHISPGHIVAHLLTSVLGCMVGFWVFFRVLSVLPSLDILRKVVAIYGGVLLAGVQYIALAGVRFEYDPTKPLPSVESTTIISAKLFIGALIGAVMFSFLVLVYVLRDLRGWLLRTRIQLRLADRAILALICRSPGARMAEQSTTSVSGKNLTTSPVAAQRQQQQAPPEVVQYAREYLKTVTERSDTRPAVFTHRHVLYYDVGTESDADSLSASREEPPGAPQILPFDQLVPRTASGVPATATEAVEPADAPSVADIESGLDKGSFDDMSAMQVVSGVRGYTLPPVRIKPPQLVPSTLLDVKLNSSGIVSVSAGVGTGVSVEKPGKDSQA